MLREATDRLCRLFGRPCTLKRDGLADLPFTGSIRGLREDDLVGSAAQADLLCVLPAAQITGRAPKKFDRIISNGRQYTIQFVRECYEGAELCSYKAAIRG
jgi:hypothetical protein